MPTESMPQHPYLQPLRPSRPFNEHVFEPPHQRQESSPKAAPIEVTDKAPSNVSTQNEIIQSPKPLVPDNHESRWIWPSQLKHNSSKPATIWMYPPSEQYEWLAQTLRTEIQSHNQTRDALHTEVQLRANFAQQLTQLSMDNAAWHAAYNDIAATLQQYTQDYTHILADNDYLRAEIQRLTAQSNRSSTFVLDALAPKDKQIRVLQKKLARQSNETKHECYSGDMALITEISGVQGETKALDYASSSYSPEV